MANSNAAAGKAYERRVVTYINNTYPDLAAFRITQPSFSDRGDIRVSTVVLQAKTSPTGTATISRYLDAATTQCSRHPGAPHIFPAVIIKRAPRVQDDLVVLRARDFFTLLNQRDATRTS